MNKRRNFQKFTSITQKNWEPITKIEAFPILVKKNSQKNCQGIYQTRIVSEVQSYNENADKKFWRNHQKYSKGFFLETPKGTPMRIYVQQNYP